MFYNTLTRKKEKFVPLQDKVRMYTCGPTVYNFAHVGNFRAYMFEDLLRRYLKYRGFKVKQVMNITDVDDKTIKGSKKEKASLKDFTAKYEKAFFEDLETLNIEKAEAYPRATEHIKEMIELIKAILDNGLAYVGEDKSVYYNVGKFKGYGKLAHIKVDELKAGARVSHDEYEKEHAADFALWKAWDKEDGDVFWESPFGKGRPGWHIECSAMSMKHLSRAFEKKFNPKAFETIDIHTGGVDNIFPHHENEIAQSEAATGKKFVNYWMHCEHLLVDGKKMSKSLGNFYTLRDLLDKGLKPKSIRWVLLTAHYRQQLNFTLDSVKAADNSVGRLMEFMDKLEMYGSDAEENKDVKADIDIAKNDFEEKLDDELNISGAAAVIFDFIRHINRLIDQKKISNKDRDLVLKQMKEFDLILGVLHKDKDKKIPKEIDDLAEKRKRARKNKDFKTADKLREEINRKGYLIEDMKDGKDGYLVRVV